jgi:hypothetical protein
MILFKRSFGLFVVLLVLTACQYSMTTQFTTPSFDNYSISNVVVMPIYGLDDNGVIAESIISELDDGPISLSFSNSEELNFQADAAEIAYLQISLNQLEKGMPRYLLDSSTKVSAKWQLISAATGKTIWSANFSKSSEQRGFASPEAEELIRIMADALSVELASRLI